MLSPGEERGLTLKRYVRAAAALNDIYDDTTLADAVEVNRGAVGGWWTGAQMKPDTIWKLAEVTGLSPEELTRFVSERLRTGLRVPGPGRDDPARLPEQSGDH